MTFSAILVSAEACVLVLLSGRLVLLSVNTCIKAVMGPGARDSGPCARMTRKNREWYISLRRWTEIREEGDDDMIVIRFVAKHGNSHRPNVSSYDVGFCDDLGNVMRLFCEQHGLEKQWSQGRVHFYYGRARCAQCLPLYVCAFLVCERVRACVYALSNT